METHRWADTELLTRSLIVRSSIIGISYRGRQHSRKNVAATTETIDVAPVPNARFHEFQISLLHDTDDGIGIPVERNCLANDFGERKIDLEPLLTERLLLTMDDQEKRCQPIRHRQSPKRHSRLQIRFHVRIRVLARTMHGLL